MSVTADSKRASAAATAYAVGCAGTDERPRLSVFRSDRHIYAQVITDESRKTILAVSTLTAELRGAAREDRRRRRRQAGRPARRARCQEKGIKRSSSTATASSTTAA